MAGPGPNQFDNFWQNNPLVSGVAARKGEKGGKNVEGWDMDKFREDYLKGLGDEEQYGFDAEREAYKRASEWDPSKEFGQYAEAATGVAGESLKKQLEALAGRSAGMGRIDTGFYDLDQGDVVRDVYGDLNRDLSSKALDVTGMRQQNNQYLLNYGSEARNRYFDLLSGGMDRRYAELYPPSTQKSGSGWGDFLKAGVSVAALAL